VPCVSKPPLDWTLTAAFFLLGRLSWRPLSFKNVIGFERLNQSLNFLHSDIAAHDQAEARFSFARRPVVNWPISASINFLRWRYRLPKNDDNVEGGSGFLGGSSIATRFGALRLRANGLAAAGLAVASGSSAFMTRR
jgi:hypothetical protein